MKKNILSVHNKEKGQSMVELALSITLLMMLLAGTIDLGRAFFTWLAFRDAAQEGASYGTFNPSNESGIKARIWDNLEQVVQNPSTNVDIVVHGLGGCAGDTLTIDVDYPDFPITMPFLGTVIGSDVIAIHATINDTIITPRCP